MQLTLVSITCENNHNYLWGAVIHVYIYIHINTLSFVGSIDNRTIARRVALWPICLTQQSGTAVYI